ncbi:MAG TPA: DUF2723 domain-containing protein [Ignavibacteria bacterium]|nr:DUF2723 domain-containing protein [Ignavibacteria bacterium]HMR39220.1 DUF2723 domain-containing protein [Ignavibacteria bacterium]
MSNNKKIIYQILSFLLPFIVYVITLAPTVTFIDSGELATVAAKLGVAHPTGYPLFTVLGRVFTLLPIGDEIYRLNLMSAFISSAALFMFFNLMSFLLGNKFAGGDSNADYKILPDDIVYNISLATVFILAFSRTFWDTANAIEVYSLHTFFLITDIYLILKACTYDAKDKNSYILKERYWLLYAFVLGLSFTNHLSSIFLSVGSLYLYFAVNGFNKISFRRILVLIIPFLIGYSFYIYLFIRADNNVLSWGYPHNFANFWRHFTGKQFSIWMFSSFENAGKQFTYFTKSYPVEFFYIPLLIAIPGMFELFKKSKKLFYFTALLFGFCVLYAINYDIYDIDSYFLLAFIVTSIWFGFGLMFILKRLKDNVKSVSIAMIFIFLIPLSQNFSKVDESKNYFVEEYTLNLFESASENAIIFSTQWDFWISSSFYQQFVKNIRPDIVVIDKELMRKTWYLHHIKLVYPEIYENSKAEFEAYSIELFKFEANPDRYTKPSSETDRQDLIKIQTTFLNLLNSMVDKNYESRGIYTTFEIEQEKTEKFGKDYNRVPEGLLIRLTKEKGYVEYKEPDFLYTFTDRKEYHYNFIMNAYYSAYLSRANYLMNFAKFDEAEDLLNRAMKVKPDAPEAGQLMKKISQLKLQQNIKPE